MSLQTIKLIFIAIGIAYFFAPIDLIPDVLGLVGRIDDLAVVIYLVWRYRKMRLPDWNKQTDQTKSGADSQAKNTRASQLKDPPPASSASDPYAVLGLAKTADRSKITESYRALIKKYHPDRVNHLGEEFQQIAHEKTIAIQRAYDDIVARIQSKRSG